MAKSLYLDNLINDRLPVNNGRYLSSLWEGYGDNTYATYRFSAINNFTNEELIAITSSDYINNLQGNQTVLDKQNPLVDSVTLNPKYLPIHRNWYTPNKSVRDSNIINHPAEYLPARITSMKGSQVYSIPILFPSSFSRSITANFAKENPVGSDTPIMAYSYTDGEDIPFEFDALADYLPEEYVGVGLKGYVDAIINILKPGKSGSVIFEPTVIVEFADITFKGVCTSVSVSYDNVYNYKSFVHAKISCQFTKLS